MKNTIHPTWFADTTVTCACGNTFQTGSTVDGLHVEICSKCHPFFTGEMKFVDTQGRVDRFMQKLQNAQTKTNKRQKKAQAKTDKAAAKSYQELLREQRVQLKQAK